ncbi:MAG: hypothetical protein K2N05_04730 [Muribaculaceae bacterium]|nr:hypothetical protein [Muribaculaceae bacterium]
MSKIYIFGIGGTGSRVLRSLTMLLAAGVKFGADEIVPIIIDPDFSNADLTRTVSLLNNYSAIRSSLKFTDNNESRFFRTSIERIVPNYTLHIKDTDDKSFQEFIGYASMSRSNRALAKMLFSEKNLESSMEVGFKYNPQNEMFSPSKTKRSIRKNETYLKSPFFQKNFDPASPGVIMPPGSEFESHSNIVRMAFFSLYALGRFATALRLRYLA